MIVVAKTMHIYLTLLLRSQKVRREQSYRHKHDKDMRSENNLPEQIR